jgi:hypothetical protein
MPTVYTYLSVPTCLYLPVCAYLSMPTCVCLLVYTYLCVLTCLYLPVCAYLSMPTVYTYVCAYLSVPICLYLPVYTYCLCLPSVPTVHAYRLCLSVPVCAYLSMPTVCTYLYVLLCLPVCNLGERSARSKAPPDSIDRLIVLIRMVLYGRSLAVHSNGGRLGCLPRRP